MMNNVPMIHYESTYRKVSWKRQEDIKEERQQAALGLYHEWEQEKKSNYSEGRKTEEQDIGLYVNRKMNNKNNEGKREN